MAQFAQSVVVESESCKYGEKYIESDYDYARCETEVVDGVAHVHPAQTHYKLRTERKVPKLGLMIVGWGGNNGTSLTAGVIANREGITWRTKHGVQTPNYFGSLSQCSTLRMGVDRNGDDVVIPFKAILPMVDPNDLEIGGWDISKANMAAAMERAQVLDYDLQRQLIPHLKDLTPLPSVYFPDFIAANQSDRADNVLPGKKQDLLNHLRQDIRQFKATRKVDRVLILWSANTERYSDIEQGLNDTADNLLASIANDEAEVSPSTLFAVAAILEHCPFINGSPQNTLVPGAIELAVREGGFVMGDDFKTGQTKLKSVLVDFLVSAGIKPTSIVSYNHLGNNDGKNLSAPQQFRSKEISKSNVVDDVVASNPILYKAGEHPDHVVVIKYVPYVGDSKRALDEYTSEIFLGGNNTISIHNVCEDSLLAVPVMLDLVIIAELVTRIEYKTETMPQFEHLHPVMSTLSYLLKAPLVPENTPIVNALFRQRACMENIFRACLGLQPEHNMNLDSKIRSYRNGGRLRVEGAGAGAAGGAAEAPAAKD